MSIAVLCAGLGAGAGAGVAHAGTLTLSAGVLTYTGTDAVDNNVFVTHPGNPGDVSKLHIVDAAESITTGGAPGCVPDDSNFGVICPVPAKLVVNVGGGANSFSDDTSGGDPVAIPLELNGGGGADEFDGGGGADVLRGGGGNDKLLGDGGNDILAGDDGDDELEGGGDNDDLAGGLGNDLLTGGAGNDVVRGGDGNDELDYSPLYALDGTDVFEGGTGYDKVGYFGRTASVDVSLDGQANDGQAGENDNIALDVDEVDGGDAADVLTGSAGPNGLAGRGGDDQIVGGGGDDVLYGDSGDDVIDGGDGNDDVRGGCHDDDITGGPGADTFFADDACDPATTGDIDVLRARDGAIDALIVCANSSLVAIADTAIVDQGDPVKSSGPGACRTIDVGTTTPGGGGTTPGGGGTTPGGGGTTPGGGGTTTTPGTTTLGGTIRARLGSALSLLTGTGRPGQAVRQRVNLKAKRRTVTLGSLVATTASRVTATATYRSRGRTIAIGATTITVGPGTPRTLSIKVSKKAESVLRRVKTASIKVAFVVRHPTTKKSLHRSTKTFRISVTR